MLLARRTMNSSSVAEAIGLKSLDSYNILEERNRKEAF